MCLIFFALHQHPEYKLIVAANRDEFYQRQTAPAGLWPNHPTIVGGYDLEAVSPSGTCGTWMAMTKTGRLAFVTNYRDPNNINPKAPSRGHLVTNFLLSGVTGEAYLQNMQPRAHEYNGFNLVVGDVNHLVYLSNYQNNIQTLTSGLYGLSNHLLDTPWPKVSFGKSAIEQVIKKPQIHADELFQLLQHEERAPDNTLPHTGIGLERERALSAMFIKTNGYGTRCSTVILVKYSGEVSFQERTYNLADFTYTTRVFDFQL
jgi:uncharacterized protein with NRDE domain